MTSNDFALSIYAFLFKKIDVRYSSPATYPVPLQTYWLHSICAGKCSYAGCGFCIHIKLTSGLKGLQYALKSLTSLIRYNIPPRQLAGIADNSTLAPLALRHPLSMVLPLFTYFCTVLFYKSIFSMSSIIFRIFDRNCRLRGDWPCVG